MFSLYVHIPYCTSICPYCDFNVYAAERRPEERYVETLVAEMRHAAGESPWRGNTLETIYLGGGTPSLFAPESIARILGAAHETWEIARGAEVTLEATPESVSVERLALYREAGVNRLSLGLQSMHSAHLRRLGRVHSVEDNHLAFAAARSAGLANVSVDLIFAVPGQTCADWEADLLSIVALAPEHISAYNLTYEERTPFFTWRARGAISPAPEEDEERFFTQAREILPAAGYEAYEISSFAPSGRRSRHNQNYWNGTDYLGLGAGAHSYRRAGWGQRWSNQRTPLRYMAEVDQSGQARAEIEILDRTQAMGEFAFLGLRQSDGIDARAFVERFGEAFEQCFARVVELVADGLLAETPRGYRLTAKGLLVADSVFALFF